MAKKKKVDFRESVMNIVDSINNDQYYVYVPVKTVKDVITALSINKKYNGITSISETILMILGSIENPELSKFDSNKLSNFRFNYIDKDRFVDFICNLKEENIDYQIETNYTEIENK